MKTVDIIIIAVFAVMSIFAAALTVKDKNAAKRRERRIPEAELMTVGLLFGALSMFITMQFIRHKTRHAKFMVGLPLFILLHAGLIAVYVLLIRAKV